MRTTSSPALVMPTGINWQARNSDTNDASFTPEPPPGMAPKSNTTGTAWKN
jgi:hypothetical protein